MGKNDKNHVEETISKLDEELNSPLKRKVVENWVYAIAIILAILTVFTLGKCNWDAIQDNWLIKGGLWTGIVLALSFMWYIVIYFLTRDVKEKKHARVVLENTKNAIKIVTDFEQSAQEVITILYQTEPLLKNLVVKPEGYSRLIKEVKNEKQEEIDTLKLMGSMVGFYCLLPLSIRNHFCESKPNVHIELIATDIELPSIGTEGNLWLYPLGLVVKSLLSIVSQCEKKWTDSRSIDFKISYLPYDILEALLIIGNHKLVNLQALGPENIEIILSNKRQVGVIVEKDDPEKQFDRYINVFNRTLSALDARQETWKLTTADKQVIELEISGKPHWQYSDEKNEPIFFSKTGYANATTPTPPLSFGNDKIKIFLESFESKLSKEGLININSKIKAKPNLSNYPCFCSKGRSNSKCTV
jgi:hypothetical protein